MNRRPIVLFGVSLHSKTAKANPPVQSDQAPPAVTLVPALKPVRSHRCFQSSNGIHARAQPSWLDALASAELRDGQLVIGIIPDITVSLVTFITAMDRNRLVIGTGELYLGRTLGLVISDYCRCEVLPSIPVLFSRLRRVTFPSTSIHLVPAPMCPRRASDSECCPQVTVGTRHAIEVARSS